jgi:hypothetical protein
MTYTVIIHNYLLFMIVTRTVEFVWDHEVEVSSAVSLKVPNASIAAFRQIRETADHRFKTCQLRIRHHA